MRSIGVGYLLWCLCFIGLCGMHRFYAGKWKTGILWVLTGGVFLVGQIIDLFFVASMVERSNRRLVGA